MKTMLRVFFLPLLVVPQLISAQCSDDLWSDFTFTNAQSCLPVKYTFTDMSTSCDGIVAWYWEFGDGFISPKQNPVHHFRQEGQFVVRLTVTDIYGNSIRRSKRITVIPSQPLSINLGHDTTICEGSSLRIDPNISGASFEWSTGDTSSSINVSVEGEYSVTVSSSGCIARDTIYVQTTPALDNKWSYINSDNCLPVEVSFSDSSSAYCGEHIESWRWDFGDGTFSNEQNPVHNFASAGTFNVTLTISNSSGTSASSSKTVVAKNIILDKPVIAQNGNSLVSPQAARYEWYRDGEVLPNETSKTLRIDKQGYYSVRIYSDAGCQNISDASFFLPLSGEELHDDIRIKCSPNPSNGTVNVLLSELSAKPAKIDVYDSHGQPRLATYASGHVTFLDLTHVPKGFYYIAIAIDNSKRILPLIIR